MSGLYLSGVLIALGLCGCALTGYGILVRRSRRRITTLIMQLETRDASVLSDLYIHLHDHPRRVVHCITHVVSKARRDSFLAEHELGLLRKMGADQAAIDRKLEQAARFKQQEEILEMSYETFRLYVDRIPEAQWLH